MPTHIDAYPHNCPGCINDPRPASDALLDEHGAAVVKLRAEAVAAPLGREKRNASPTAASRHRGR